MKIYVKNIECPCCERYVRRILESHGIQVIGLDLCEIQLDVTPSMQVLRQIDAALREANLMLLEDEHSILVEKMKSEIKRLVRNPALSKHTNLSDYLSNRLDYNYSYLSNYFSKSEQMTIRDYAIQCRIAVAKQMVAEDQLDLVAISERLQYSSTAHLAAQFKKITGMTTSEFKRRNEFKPAA